MTNEELIKTLEEHGDTVYILDRGLIRFGKFAVSLLAIFAIVGVSLFGWDINKAAEEAAKARSETDKTLAELNEAKVKLGEANSTLLKARNDLDASRVEFTKYVNSSKEELQKELGQAEESSRRVSGYEQEIAVVRFRLLQGDDAKSIQAILAAAKERQPSVTYAEVPGVTKKIALVSEIKELSSLSLELIAGSLQKQAQKDLKPIWHVDAIVQPFASLSAVPSDFWPLIIKRDVDTPGALGFHSDKNGQPFAVVTYQTNLSDMTIIASHEMLGMLVDPWGNHFIVGPSPNPADNGRVVNFLVEISQPIENNELAYDIDGLKVSDFVTPAFYSAFVDSTTKLSFRGSLKSTRKVEKPGYLSWTVPETHEWYQETWFDGETPKYHGLGKLGG
jgi:hypothetical protein